MTKQSYVRLNSGYEMPQMGLGVFMIPEGKATVQAVRTALDLGYRQIDTAHAYQNERSVGRAVKESGIPREEIFITTKLWVSDYGYEKSLAQIDKMLERLDTDYIDLLLLHQPVGDYIGAYRTMEEAVKQGKVRSIGLSNFEGEALDEVLEAATNKPAALQVELHPYATRSELRKQIKPYDIHLESWYPLGHGDTNLLNEAIFQELGQKYGKSPAQIILRWHIQMGNLVFPKSTSRAHLQENIDIFDFELSKQEMAEIAKLDQEKRYYDTPIEERAKLYRSIIPAD